MCNKILNAEFKGDKYFVDKVETQLIKGLECVTFSTYHNLNFTYC
jgi:hypothetical protein